MIPATHGDVYSWRSFHRDCGGHVTAFFNRYSCGKCTANWRVDTIRRFTSSDLADRFYVKPIQDQTQYVLVRHTDGKNKFARLLPRSLAAGKEPVR